MGNLLFKQGARETPDRNYTAMIQSYLYETLSFDIMYWPMEVREYFAYKLKTKSNFTLLIYIIFVNDILLNKSLARILI